MSHRIQRGGVSLDTAAGSKAEAPEARGFVFPNIPLVTDSCNCKAIASRTTSILSSDDKAEFGEGEAHQVLIEDAPIDLVPEDRFDQILGNAIQPLSRTLSVFPLRSQISQLSHIPTVLVPRQPRSIVLAVRCENIYQSYYLLCLTVHTEPHFG